MMAEMNSYIILFLSWLIPTILLRALFRKRPTCRLPPGPFALPIIGHFHVLAPLLHQSFQKLSDKYGPLMLLWFGSVPCAVVSSPEMAKEFLKTHETSFSDRPLTATIDYLTYGSQGFAFAPYGPYWRFMKKLCMTELLGGKTLQLLHPVRSQEINKFIELLLIKAKAGETVDVGRELVMLTNNVISRMATSTRCSGTEDEAGNIRKLSQEATELIGKFNPSDYIKFLKNVDLHGYGKKLKDVCNRIDMVMERTIIEHQEANIKRNGSGEVIKDLLDILLDISEDESSERKLTRENIKAFIQDLFVAGTDTSAVTIEWVMAALINHPNIMQKAAQEIDSVIGKSRLVEESDIEDLPYLQAILKETMRLHPTIPLIVRASNEDCSVGGYHIPAKSTLMVNVWAINRDPKYWENPLEFKPERFLNEDGSTKTQLDLRGQHYQFLPFGSGRRGCPGITLALQVILTTLAAMIQCFEWRLSDKDTGKIDMEARPGITLRIANTLNCVPVARLRPFPTMST
ncbi:cytochrome P450 93A3-like [Lycium ferocissimum]|uniref:cytochrome P450 93A3-like n=1 Tax=Lycium ferocissimum TaxID=112874 RepID=UPI0028167FC8|nr:cytochrome P450 93A3-like [Lycium ferocissimum]